MQSVPEVCIICSNVPSFLPHSNFIALHLPCRGGWGRPGGRGGGVGRGGWGEVGGLAPADSEVRNLHLIAVCQPMM